MSLDLKRKDTYYYVQDDIMCRDEQPPDGDCLGRTALAFIAYKWFGFFSHIGDFWCYENKHIQVYRQPLSTENNISRDHVSYLLIIYKYAKFNHLVKHICKLLGWKLSDEHSMTIDFWLWTRALYSKFWLFTFVNFQCLHLSIMSLWNCVLFCVMGISPEYTEKEWDLNITRNRTPLQKKLTPWLFPAYAVHNLAWQLYVLDRKPWLLRKIVLTMTGKTNYLVRLLLGGKVTSQQVFGYQSMTGYRWSTRLDETNDRHVELCPQEANDLEKDLLIEIWNETQKL